ncbi:hypothetical protein FXO38_28511 [Capsicum annuum]|nr:hypothetical protein FXO37_30333 [Capsicum annuum]KAF3627924.1 hypothetical protein FXO38_28511 [Capsicum annuum]
MMWKKAFGINVYEMLDNCFLFEFPNRYMAEQVPWGEWQWKKSRLKLEWWNPAADCVPINHKPKSIWIRALGLPMHLWKEEIFREIGELCGGWLATEEETKLRNHLKWARIETRGDVRNMPTEVTISRDGVNFIIPIWVEGKTRFELSMEREGPVAKVEKTQRKNHRITETSSSIPETSQHVDGDGIGETYVGIARDYLKLTAGARDGHVHSLKNNLALKPVGPDQAKIIANNFNPQPAEDFFKEVIVDETAVIFSADYVQSNQKTKEAALTAIDGKLQIEGDDPVHTYSVGVGEGGDHSGPDLRALTPASLEGRFEPLTLAHHGKQAYR